MTTENSLFAVCLQFAYVKGSAWGVRGLSQFSGANPRRSSIIHNLNMVLPPFILFLSLVYLFIFIFIFKSKLDRRAGVDLWVMMLSVFNHTYY